MSTPNDKEIDYQVGQHIVRARSYEEACAKLDRVYFSPTQPSPAAVEQALAQEKANQEQIGATVQAVRASATQLQPQQDRQIMRDITADKYYKLSLQLEQQRDALQAQLKATFLQLSEAEQERDVLQDQRDELLVACRVLLPYIEACVEEPTDAASSDLGQLRAAIARATEGGTGQ